MASADMRHGLLRQSITSMLQPLCAVSKYAWGCRARRQVERGSPGGDSMTFRSSVILASAAITLAAVAIPVRAGGDKVAFPENHEAGVLFTTVDRTDNKQFREFYTGAAAFEAANKGEPLPSRAGITMRQYAAKLDARGNPEKSANRRFIKGNPIG